MEWLGHEQDSIRLGFVDGIAENSGFPIGKPRHQPVKNVVKPFAVLVDRELWPHHRWRKPRHREACIEARIGAAMTANARTGGGTKSVDLTLEFA